MAAREECPICGGRVVGTWEKSGYHLGRCPSCALIVVMDEVSKEKLKAHYNQGHQAADYRGRYATISKGQRVKWQKRLEEIERRLGERRPGKILDIGCAYGAFLSIAQEAGWRTTGVEVMEEGRRASMERLGHERVYGKLSEVTEVGFDAVCMWDLIEHLPDPLLELEHVSELLSDGGLLALSTPNTGSWPCRWFGAGWCQFKPPSHLVYFNRANLERALSKAGFEMVRSWTHFVPHQFWHSLTGGPRQSLGWRVVGRGLTLPLGVASRCCGTGDTLLAIGRLKAHFGAAAPKGA